MTILTGTSGNTWREFADGLSAAAKDVLVSSVLNEEAAERLRSRPKPALVVFAESPASLIVDCASDPSAAVNKWKTSATALLGRWRRDRTSVTILDWDECLADPIAFQDWLSSNLGIEAGKVVPNSALAGDSLAARVIAGIIAGRDRQCARLWSELQTASQPISNKAGAIAPTDPELALAELMRSQKRHAAERAKLAAELAANRQNATRSQEMLLQEIQNAHRESENFFEQMEKARAESESAKKEVEHTAALLQEAHAGTRDLETKHHALHGDLDALQAELQSIKANALSNHEMLLQEIQNAHKESEDFFEQWKSLEASSQAHYLTVQKILRGGEKHHPPHSHLDYVLEGASLFDRQWHRLPVRLVEHHGRAGLALFKPYSHGPAPLYHWKPDGHENGADFALFVPADRQSRPKLTGAPSSDLLLVRDAAAKILGHLSVHGGPEAGRWLPVARRLLQEIEEIPERLHYDSVAGFSGDKADPSSIRFNAANLYYRGNCSRSFVLDWVPASSGGRLRIPQESHETPPMLVHRGVETVVGFESPAEVEALEKLWPQLTHRDRTFLLLLAKALPDFVFHLCEQHPDQKPHKDRLTKQARQLYRRLCNLDRRHRLKGAIAKLIRNRA